MSETEIVTETVEEVEEVRPIAGIGTLVFGKWDVSDITCKDPGLAPYINLAVDMLTLGSERQNYPSLSATSTNSCEPVHTPGKSKAP